jgi:hypothetical protein
MEASSPFLPLASAARNSSRSALRDKTHVIAPRCIVCSAARIFRFSCTRKRLEKNLIQMITLIAVFRFIAMEGKQRGKTRLTEMLQ